MSKMYYFLLFVLIIVSCKDSVSETGRNQDSGWSVTPSNLPKKNKVNAKATTILNNWIAYKELETSFDKIYTSEFREDFVLVIEGLIEKQKALEASEYPTEFNVPQIKGRQKVFKTYVLKTKGNLEYRQNPEIAIKEMIAAFNELRGQFNVMVNNTLPEDLILNEEN